MHGHLPLPKSKLAVVLQLLGKLCSQFQSLSLRFENAAINAPRRRIGMRLPRHALFKHLTTGIGRLDAKKSAANPSLRSSPSQTSATQI